MHDPQKDSFLSPERYEEAEHKVKDSRFIACLCPVSSEGEAYAFIQKIRSRYHHAAHHCYAFRIEEGEQMLFRYNDAGEPSGTAGPAILSAIEQYGLSNVVLVVSRYFGGTKLGRGPLRRAYRESARIVMAKCQAMVRYHMLRFSFRVPYEFLNGIKCLLREVKARIVTEKYEEEASFMVDVRKSLCHHFQKRFQQMTGGKEPQSIRKDKKKV